MLRRIHTISTGGPAARIARRRIRHLDDQAAFGSEKPVCFREISLRPRHMLQHMEHGNGRTASGRYWRCPQFPCNCWHALPLPGQPGSLFGDIQTQHLTAPLPQHAEKQPATTAHIQEWPGRAGFAEGAPDEVQVVAQHQPPVPLLHAAGRVFGGVKPVTLRIVQIKFFWRRRR